MADSNLFRAAPEQSKLQKFGEMLGGFGAGVQGRGPEYISAIQERRAEEERKRLAAMVKDAKQAYDFINRGDVNNAEALIQDRVQMINRMGGDPSDTARIGSMIQSGNIGQAKQELESFLRPFMPTEAVKASDVTEQGQYFMRDPLGGGVQARDVGGFTAPPPKGPSVAIMQPEPDFETTMRRESVQAQMGDINEQLAESPRIISTANDIKQLVNLMGKANLNKAESALVDKYGLTATNLLNLGPETEAAVSLVSRLAPQMRPAGSGATSDFEARLYINSLPAFLQSDGGRKLTELVFAEYADIENQKLRARSDYNARRLNYVDYLDKITDLNSRSLFENDAKRRQVEAIIPNFFNEVSSKIQLRSINPAITPVG